MSEEELSPEEAEEHVRIELVEEKKPEDAAEAAAEEEVEEAELEYDISDPILLDVMLQVTDLLERVARGGVTISEAKAEYNIIVSRLSDATKKKTKTARKKSSKRSGGSKKRKKSGEASG